MRRATAASVCSSSMLVIRKAEPRDVPQMLAFIRELAEYEKEPQAVVATEDDPLRVGFGQAPRYFCLVAGWEGAPAGVGFCVLAQCSRLGRWGGELRDREGSGRARGAG